MPHDHWQREYWQMAAAVTVRAYCVTIGITDDRNNLAADDVVDAKPNTRFISSGVPRSVATVQSYSVHLAFIEARGDIYLRQRFSFLRCERFSCFVRSQIYFYYPYVGCRRDLLRNKQKKNHLQYGLVSPNGFLGKGVVRITPVTLYQNHFSCTVLEESI